MNLPRRFAGAKGCNRSYIPSLVAIYLRPPQAQKSRRSANYGFGFRGSRSAAASRGSLHRSLSLASWIGSDYSAVKRSPGWQPKASQSATSVVNRTALARLFLSTDRLATVTPTWSARAASVISRSARSWSSWQTTLCSFTNQINPSWSSCMEIPRRITTANSTNVSTNRNIAI